MPKFARSTPFGIDGKIRALMLRILEVSKSFGPTRAVDDVSLTIGRGDVVGLIGENGAGKSTLMSIVAGELPTDHGTLERPASIGIVHQHFALVSQFTIAENLALVRERRSRFVRQRELEAQAERAIDESGIELRDVRRLAADLSVGERAKLELIKAVAAKPELLILDEPTSVLTPLESAELFRLIERLAAAGTGVVFITHKIPEVLEVARRLVVMRRGRIVADTTAAGMTGDDIANAMVEARSALERSDTAPLSLPGEQTAAPGRRTPRPAGSPLIEASHVAGSALQDVSFAVRRLEIVAIVGVAGNGQGELADMLRGLARPRGGELAIDTRRIGFIPEDRTRQALVGEMTIAENVALGGRWNPSEARHRATSLIQLYGIRARGPLQLAVELSGGNQQKVVVARELDRKPDLIVASEPTRGLDIEATRFVHTQLRTAVAAGAGVLLITSDLDEAFALADGIHVIYRGRLSERLTPKEASQRVASLMAGLNSTTTDNRQPTTGGRAE